MNMFYIEKVKGIWPGLTDEEADVALWSFTKYPVVVGDEAWEQLRDMYERSGGDFEVAMDLALQDLEAGGVLQREREDEDE